ncbi:MAG: signal peptidase II [Clostridia bacterium]|nr:signal peptidase II [Clostridia bacterium]
MKKKDGWFRRIWPGVLVLLVDRLVKWIHLTVAGDQTVRNSGMAFGMLQGNSAVILIVSVLLLIACFFLVRKSCPSGPALIALSMIAGGALGNMIDRLLHGYVIDMFPFFGWFVFNVADVGVVAGAVLCGWSLLFRPSDWSAKEK